MATKLPIETARVINSLKFEDRSLKSEIYTPTDIQKRGKGSLYFLVEILNPWHPSAQIAEMIVETVKGEYYRIDEQPLASFERALKKLNTKLAGLAKEGETSWVGNLNAVIAVMAEDKILLTFTGSAEAYLFRNEKISRISTKTRAANDHYPFLEITSGKIQLGDRFIFANSDLFDYISLDTLRDSTKEEGVRQTAQYIKDVLAKEGQPAVNTILVKIALPDPKFNHLPDVVYLDRAEEGSRFKIARGAKEFYRQNLPEARKRIIKLGYKVIKGVHKANRFFANFILSSEKETGERVKEPKGWDRYAGQSIKKEKSTPKLAVGGYFRRSFAFIAAIDKRWLILGAIILVLILGFGIYYSRQNHQQVSLADRIAEIQTMIESAETKSALHQPKEAKKILLDAQNRLNDLRNNAQIATEVNDLAARIEKDLNQIDKIVVLKHPWKDLSDLNQGQFTTDWLAVSGKNLLTVSGDFGQIYQINQQKRVAELASLPQQAGQIESMLKPESLEELFILAKEKKIYRYHLDSKKISTLDLDLADINFIDWASYLGNLYFLDSEAKTIWRYRQAAVGYSAGQPLFKGDQIKDALSMAIDGEIYILKKNGSIFKYLIGETRVFKTKGLPSPENKIREPRLIYTNSDLEVVYLVDNSLSRVIKYQKNNGQYLKQYRLPEKIDDLAVIGGKLYILTQNQKIFQAE